VKLEINWESLSCGGEIHADSWMRGEVLGWMREREAKAMMEITRFVVELRKLE
jgi:hypothetical protein